MAKKRRFRLGLVTTLWKRDRIERFVLNYYSKLRIPGVQLIKLAIGSEGPRSSGRAVENGWDYVEYSNDWLTDKWIAGVQTMRDDDLDALMIVGSDDLVNRSFIKDSVELVKEGIDYTSPNGLFFYDLKRHKSLFLPAARIGAGRTLSRRALDAVDWAPWQRKMRKSVDYGQTLVLEEAGFTEHLLDMDYNLHDRAILDIKSSVNIWDFARMEANPVSVPVESELLFKRFPGLDEHLPNWQTVT